MTTEIAELARRLRLLEDREEIRSIVAQYGPLADAGEAEAVAALWATDGSYNVSGFAASKGRGAIADLISGPVHKSLMDNGCAHLLGPVAIDLDGDRATARGHSVVLRNSVDGFALYRVSANRWDFARGADGWQVIHRENALLDGNAAARALFIPRSGHHP